MEQNSSEDKIFKELRRTRLVLYLVVLFVAITSALPLIRKKTEDISFDSPQIMNDMPFREEVRKLIAPLRYNGLYRLMLPNVRITPNFGDMTWTLRNVHRFDEKGNVLLENGRFGVCGDLAAYAYQKLKPTFGSQYAIDFAVVAESSFFKYGGGTHNVLRVANKTPFRNGASYLIDPAFKKYGAPDPLFRTYTPLSFVPLPDFLRDRSPDETFDLDSGPPVLINRNVLLSLYVLNSNGLYDKDNFTVALAKSKRYEYLSRFVYAVTMSNGARIVHEEPDSEVTSLVTPGVYENMKKMVDRLFDQMAKDVSS